MWWRHWKQSKSEWTNLCMEIAYWLLEWQNIFRWYSLRVWTPKTANATAVFAEFWKICWKLHFRISLPEHWTQGAFAFGRDSLFSRAMFFWRHQEMASLSGPPCKGSLLPQWAKGRKKSLCGNKNKRSFCPHTCTQNPPSECNRCYTRRRECRVRCRMANRKLKSLRISRRVFRQRHRIRYDIHKSHFLWKCSFRTCQSNRCIFIHIKLNHFCTLDICWCLPNI